MIWRPIHNYFEHGLLSPLRISITLVILKGYFSMFSIFSLIVCTNLGLLVKQCSNLLEVCPKPSTLKKIKKTIDVVVVQLLLDGL